MRTSLLALVTIAFFASCAKNNEEPTPETAKFWMGSKPYDVYYSLETGKTDSVERNWDLAFSTDSRTSSILINEATGVKLYTLKGDTTLWAKTLVTADTLGMTKREKHNSDTSWYYSAFERNKKLSDWTNFGWGTYNPVSHTVTADSVFVVKLANGTHKKVFLRKRDPQGRYHLLYSDIDGSNKMFKAVEAAQYTSTSNFVYFSFATGNVTEREPARGTWDFVLTRYYEYVTQPAPTLYPVNGLLLHPGLTSAEYATTDSTTNNYSAATFVTSAVTIGSDWKSVNMFNGTYYIRRGVVYFVKTKNNHVYKVLFTNWNNTKKEVTFQKTRLK